MDTLTQHTTKDGIAFVVREAVPTDAEQLLAETKAAIEERLDYLITQPSEFAITVEQEYKWIQEHADAENSVLMIAEQDSELIGWAILRGGKRAKERHAGLLGITVVRKWRGRGVGIALVRAILDWAIKNPIIEKVKLAVVTTNEPAIALYRKLGFVEEGYQPREYKKADGTYLDNLLMYQLVGEIHGT